MEMGFSEAACRNALGRAIGTTMEQAMDYLLQHPEPPPSAVLPQSSTSAQAALAPAPSTSSAPAAGSSTGGIGSALGIDMSDQEQMMRAIAISLGQSFAALESLTHDSPATSVVSLTLFSSKTELIL